MTLRAITGRGVAAVTATAGRIASDLALEAGDWTCIYVPDSQNLVAYAPAMFAAQCNWIAYNVNRLNIQMVLHVGDVVNTATQPAEWEAANGAWAAVDTVNLPYIFVPGNHDYDYYDPSRPLVQYNRFFGQSRYTGKTWWDGGFYDGSAAENLYLLRTIGGVDYIFLGLEFGPRQAMIDWAAALLDTYSDRTAIFLAHSYMHFDDTRTGAGDIYSPKWEAYNLGADVHDGDDLWTELVKLKANIILVYSGHQIYDGINPAVGQLVEAGDNANTVNQVLANYQEQYSAFLRVLIFRADGQTIDTYTYSPALNVYLTDSQNQFSSSY